MFNDLTGANQYVGNWPGVTVEKKEGKYTKDKDVTVTDLPASIRSRRIRLKSSLATIFSMATRTSSSTPTTRPTWSATCI